MAGALQKVGVLCARHASCCPHVGSPGGRPHAHPLYVTYVRKLIFSFCCGFAFAAYMLYRAAPNALFTVVALRARYRCCAIANARLSSARVPLIPSALLSERWVVEAGRKMESTMFEHVCPIENEITAPCWLPSFALLWTHGACK